MSNHTEMLLVKGLAEEQIPGYFGELKKGGK